MENFKHQAVALFFAFSISAINYTWIGIFMSVAQDLVTLHNSIIYKKHIVYDITQ